MRTIKVYNTEKNPPLQDVELDGNTVQELCSVLGITLSNKRVTGRTTRADYSDIDGIISAQDEYIFIGPKKMSSGAEVTGNFADDADTLEDLKEVLNAKINETIDFLFDLAQQAKETVSTGTPTEDPNCPECNQLEQEARSLGLRG